MGWEFWRIEWPTAAVVFALAMVPVWLFFTHLTGISQRTSVELASEPESAVIAMTDQHGHLQAEQGRE